MGCDFYTFYKLCIEYKKDDALVTFTFNMDETRDRNDWWHVERDEDFEEWDAFFTRRKLEHERQIQSIFASHYPKITLCHEGIWKCIESAKEKYLAIAEEAGIPTDTIVNVWKEGDYWVR